MITPRVDHHSGVVHDLHMADIRSDEDLLRYVRSLPLADRARLGRMLAKNSTVKALGAISDEAVYLLTRDKSWAEVAKELGVSVATVNKAVSRHKGVKRPRSYPAEDE